MVFPPSEYMVVRLLLKCALIALPILLQFGLVALVDPYELFGERGPVPHALKEKNLYHSGRTMPFNNVMWKLVEYERSPRTNVIFGDSRLAYFDLDTLEKISGDRYFNFGVPGGNQRTLKDLFAFADSLSPLSKVYVQLSYKTLNKGVPHDLYREPRKLLDEPMLYVSNRRVMEATGLNLLSWKFPDQVSYDQPSPDQWSMVLDAERANVAHFELVTNVYKDLQHIADRCRAKGAKLVFLEYPTHPDAQRIYSDAGLDAVRDAFLDRLRRMAPVVDLDRPGLFPSDRGFWRDPVHLTIGAQRTLIARVWGPAQ